MIDSPEIIALLPTFPSLTQFTTSLHSCSYSNFFKSLAIIETDHLLISKLLNPHTRFYVRELRIKAYTQLLESYRSVTLKNLAIAFGVSEEYIDAYVPPSLSHKIS